VRSLALFLTGNWKVPLTRRLESLRHVAQTFLSAGSGDFPVARLVTFNAPIQEQCQDAPGLFEPRAIGLTRDCFADTI
jgi:hypothetical protein